MQQTLTVKRGTAWLRRFEGVVLHGDLRHETEILSSGGGGHVGPSGGYVAAPRITSTTTERQTLFARDESGIESKFEWFDWTLPVRPGSRIAVVWGARTGKASGPYLGATNLDTKEERWAFDGWFRGQRLVTVRLHGWRWFFISFVMAGVMGYAWGYQELSRRPRPEKLALDVAESQLSSATSDTRAYQADRYLLGRYLPLNSPGSPQRVAAAQRGVNEAKQALARASANPFDPRPGVTEVFAYFLASDVRLLGFAATWCATFVVLFLLAALAVGRNDEDERTEARVREFLRTGSLPS